MLVVKSDVAELTLKNDYFKDKIYKQYYEMNSDVSNITYKIKQTWIKLQNYEKKSRFNHSRINIVKKLTD